MHEEDRLRFDRLVEDEIDRLPPMARQWLEEVPVVVLDEPTDAMWDDLGVGPLERRRASRELCGLHTGVSLTDRSIEQPDAHALDQIHLFRLGILHLASGWDWEDDRAQERLAEQIRITLLHELGHHFGLDEDDLDRLGYA